MDFNRVFLLGRVGKEPEEKTFSQDRYQIRFSLATHYYVRQTREGESTFEQKTQWQNIVAWGVLAQLGMKKIHKGDLLFVEGTLRIQKKSFSKNQTEPLEERLFVEIHAQRFCFFPTLKTKDESDLLSKWREGKKSEFESQDKVCEVEQ